jgi:pyruvate/2-oxoglutarate dehydrogenase complex dihydrolipoamide acyltransferase (E2) component
MGIEEGTVVRWLKKEGERIKNGEIVVEVETAKAIQEVESLVDGTLVTILVKEGETADVNATLALVDEEKG